MKPRISWAGLWTNWRVTYGRSVMDQRRVTFTSWEDALNFALDPIIQSLRNEAHS